MATNPNSYVELVSLYFEGALNGDEKLAVYSTLSVAEEARLEFEAALFLQRTLDRDTLAAVPASVKEGLFRRAGIALPMDESAAPKRKRMDVAAIAFLLGALSVFSIDRLWSGPGHEVPLTSVQRTSQITPVPGSASILQQVPKGSAQVKSAEAAFSNVDRIVRPVVGRPISKSHDEASIPSAVPLEYDTTRIEARPSTDPEMAPLNTDDQASAQISEVSSNSITEEAPVLSTASRGQFEVSLLHTNAPRYFPNRDAAAGSILDNSCIAVRYKIASDHWLGIAAGNDVLPLEIMQGKREVIVSTIDWAGISYQLNIRSNKLPLLYPFLRETIGVTKFGLLAKTGVGVRFSPNDIIHAALGLEHTTMPVRTSDVMRGTGKLSLAYDISIQF